jgi:4-amino-4-deoxy-L-arabinose transferase-like glycosyltransferase
LVVVSIVLPWFLMIQHISAGQFLQDSAHGDLLSKILSGVENHAAPPFSYLLTHFAVFWPVSLLSPFAILMMWKNRKINDGYVFILASIIPIWIVFELIPTKLPHYTYPLYSLLIAGISGICIALVRENYAVLKGKLFFPTAFIYVCVSLAVAVIIPFSLFYYQQEFNIFTILLSILSVILCVFAVIQLRNGLLHGVVVTLILQTLTLVPHAFANVVPRIDAFNLASRMNDAIDNSDCSRNAVFVSGYREPSVMFKIGTRITFSSTEELIEKFKVATPCSLFFIGEKNDLFQQAFMTIQPIAILQGIKINGGDTVTINLYKR